MNLWERRPSGLIVPRTEPPAPEPQHLHFQGTVYVHDALGGGIEYGHRLGEPTPSLFEWTEGNWSCDCNRAGLFNHANDGTCYCRRYIVVDVTPMPEGYTLDEFNPGYPEDLKQLARQIQAQGFEVKM